MFYNIPRRWIMLRRSKYGLSHLLQSAKGVATSDTPTPAALPSIHFWIGWVGVHGADTIGTEATKEKAPDYLPRASEKTTHPTAKGCEGYCGRGVKNDGCDLEIFFFLLFRLPCVKIAVVCFPPYFGVELLFK